MTIPSHRPYEARSESRWKVSLRRFGDAPGVDAPGVYCPRQGREMPLLMCTGCQDCLGLSIDTSERGTFLRCRWNGHDAREPLSLPVPELDSPERVTTPIKAVMTPAVESVRPDTPLEDVVAILLQLEISAVPVVDAAGKPRGLLSKTDLLRRYHEHGDARALGVTALAREDGVEIELGPGFHTLGGGAPVASQVMTPSVLSLSEDASVQRAAALMAYEGVHRIVVVREDGTVAGILSSLDILRWIACDAGFVIPDSRAHVSAAQKE